MLEKFGRYEIKEEIGRGGMATVYLAHDPHFKRDVAIKVLPRQFTHDPMFRTRFEREAQTIASLEHPAIVPVYDFGEENEQPFLVMRYMPGGTLAHRIAGAPVPLEEAVEIVRRVAGALDEAHSKGIVHRDLKPGNILFDHLGNAFLSDFGIVKLAEATASITGSAVIGTPAYMSPEQVHGDKEIDGRSDIYTLGAILFEMFTGRQPYAADTPAKMMMAHLLDPVPRILDVRHDLPPTCETIIGRAMAKDRDERFKTGSELAAAVATAVRPESPPPVEPPPLPPEIGHQTTVVDRPDEKKTAVPFWAWGVLAVVGLALLFWGGRAFLGGSEPTAVPQVADSWTATPSATVALAEPAATSTATATATEPLPHLLPRQPQ